MDYAHFKFVHGRDGIPSGTSTFITDGPFSTVIEQLPDGTDFNRQTWGPGIALLRIPNFMTVYTTTTPIDQQHCRLHWHFYFKGELIEMADELIDFLPPSGWGDLVRKSDLEATERRLDSDIDALGARLDAKIDALGARLDARIDALSQRVESLQEEVRRLGNLRSTIIITGLSLFVGLGSLMVAMFEVTGR